MSMQYPTPPPPLPQRDPAGHKGTFGTVAIVGGCAMEGARMFGAPALAARAALRSGCGLAKLVVPEPVLDRAIMLTPSATGRAMAVDDNGNLVPHLASEVLDEAAGDADAVVVGPGLGLGDGAGSVVLRAISRSDVPVVLDADGLNLLAAMADFAGDIQASAVLTPHPGEFGRLADALKIGSRECPSDPASRPAAAERMAQRIGCVVVLKGAGTVVSDGLRTWVCQRGHACLATAGTGDVLAGLIGGLIAQFAAPGPRAIGSVELPRPPGKPLDLFDAARLAVEAHAIAGELWAERRHADAGLLADELADLLPGVLSQMRA